MNTDTTKTTTAKSTVLAALKNLIVSGAADARAWRADGQRHLAASRAARAAGDVATAEKLLVQCFTARADATETAYLRRHELLAYGFLRGLPYRAIESRCAEGNKPNARAVHRILTDWFSQSGDLTPVTEAEIARWVDAVAPAEQVREAA